MGWTSYHANYYKKNGQVDRKKECDAYFMEGLNRGHFEVVKSAMVGSVYYAAVKTLKRRVGEKDGKDVYENIPAEEQITWGVVFLTSSDRKDYYNFSYKDMDETMGPCESCCPMSILKLLSPTDHEYALNWRNRCKEYHAKKKDPNSLHNLPVGAVIEFEYAGKTVRLRKHAPAYQFKKPFWYEDATDSYCKEKNIPEHYKVVS